MLTLLIAVLLAQVGPVRSTSPSVPPGTVVGTVTGGVLVGAAVTGTLTTTNDTVTIPLPGSQWATAQFTVTSAGTASATALVSIDGGRNYIASAYAKRLSTISANPTVQPISATTLVTGDVWEVPLPGNATHFRLLCGATGTTTTVSLSGGALYVPGVPVTAVLYDVTSATNTQVQSPTIDGSGWSSARFDITASGGVIAGSGVQSVDDAGTSYLVCNPAGAAGYLLQFGTPSSIVAGIGGATTAQVPKRFNAYNNAVAAQTSRVRVEARR